jgi:hypothetical protein
MSSAKWYRSLSDHDKYIANYFQVFEFAILNHGANPDQYRLDNPELIVSDHDGCAIHFKDLVRPISRIVPDDWFCVEHESIGGALAIFRINMKSDLDKLKPYAHLGEVKPKGERIAPTDEELEAHFEEARKNAPPPMPEEERQSFLDMFRDLSSRIPPHDIQ